MFQVRVSFRNDNPDTIWNKLAVKLGREPTNAEAAQEVQRILEGVLIDRAEAGRLPHQRRRLSA